MGEQRKPDVDDARKSSGSLHSGKQVRDPSDIRVAVYYCTAADYEENHMTSDFITVQKTNN